MSASNLEQANDPAINGIQADPGVDKKRACKYVKNETQPMKILHSPAKPSLL